MFQIYGRKLITILQGLNKYISKILRQKTFYQLITAINPRLKHRLATIGEDYELATKPYVRDDHLIDPKLD